MLKEYRQPLKSPKLAPNLNTINHSFVDLLVLDNIPHAMRYKSP